MTTAPPYLNLYLDHPRIGCGWRAYLVLRAGRKRARVICTETAETITIDAAILRAGRPLDLKRARLVRRLRQVARCYGLEKTAGVRDALALLRAAA